MGRSEALGFHPVCQGDQRWLDLFAHGRKEFTYANTCASGAVSGSTFAPTAVHFLPDYVTD